jgi:hypothetical protein
LSVSDILVLTLKPFSLVSVLDGTSDADMQVYLRDWPEQQAKVLSNTVSQTVAPVMVFCVFVSTHVF